MKAFADLVKRNVDDTNQMKWSSKLNDFIEYFENSKQVVCICSTISYSINPRETNNKNRYADVNSHQQAEKVATIIHSWEVLISKKKEILNGEASNFDIELINRK